jgi:FKBP-type peptidyl-prolyl cis-trans isomerase
MSSLDKRKLDDNVEESNKKLKATPKNVIDKIIAAIRFLKSPTGSSTQAISKHCKIEYDFDNVKSLKKAIQTGLTKNILIQLKNSYLVTEDDLYEDSSEKIIIEEIKKSSSKDDEFVKDGDTVNISYKGTLHDNNKQFDTGKNFIFTVGTSAEVIKGMNEGVKGMRITDRRKITIPSSLAYGKRGSSPDIPPNAVLCFDITLKQIT